MNDPARTYYSVQPRRCEGTLRRSRGQATHVDTDLLLMCLRRSLLRWWTPCAITQHLQHFPARSDCEATAAWERGQVDQLCSKWQSWRHEIKLCSAV